MRVQPEGGGWLVTLVLLVSGSVLASAVSGLANGAAVSPSMIIIHEQGKFIQTSAPGTGVQGEFTIAPRGLRFGPAGTTVFAVPGNTRYVNGEAQVPFSGTDHLTSTKGRIDLAVTGTRIDLNQKVTPSGDVVGPVVRYGTWKVEAATGIYRGWNGGGNFAAIYYGYANAQPYSVEWDG